jgi:hypothetical protein
LALVTGLKDFRIVVFLLYFWHLELRRFLDG